MTEINCKLLPAQYDYVADPSPWVLNDGGRGTGKSFSLCWKLFVRASTPGAVELLARLNFADLKKTTLRTLIEGDGEQPPVIPPGTYTHNKSDHIIRIAGGGTIIYSGLDHGAIAREQGSTGKGSSMNLTGAAFDEAVEISEANIIQISGGVRLKVPGVPLQRYMACNPGPPSHWLCKRFGMGEHTEPMDGHSRHHSKPTDNYHLPKETIVELERLEGVAKKRYLLGEWVGSDGMVYDTWDRSVHVTDTHRAHKRVFVGVDEGYSDPFTAYRIEQDAEGHFHVSDGVYESNWQRADKVAAVKRLDGGDRAKVIVDSAAPELIDEMRSAGLHATACKKGKGSVNEGIGVVQQQLSNVKRGEPGLTVATHLTDVIREFESYEWRPGLDGRLTDAPYDRYNHAMDAIRYALSEAVGKRPVWAV